MRLIHTEKTPRFFQMVYLGRGKKEARGPERDQWVMVSLFLLSASHFICTDATGCQLLPFREALSMEAMCELCFHTYRQRLSGSCYGQQKTVLIVFLKLLISAASWVLKTLRTREFFSSHCLCPCVCSFSLVVGSSFHKIPHRVGGLLSSTLGVLYGYTCFQNKRRIFTQFHS